MLVTVIIVAGIVVAIGRSGDSGQTTAETIVPGASHPQIERLSATDYSTISPWLRKLINATKKGFTHPEYQLCDISGGDVADVLRDQCKGTMSLVGTMTTFGLCLNAAKGKATNLCAATAFDTLNSTYLQLLKLSRHGASLFTADSPCGRLLFHPQAVKKNQLLVNKAKLLVLNGGPALKVKKAFVAALSINNPTGNDITLAKLATACKP